MYVQKDLFERLQICELKGKTWPQNQEHELVENLLKISMVSQIRVVGKFIIYPDNLFAGLF